MRPVLQEYGMAVRVSRDDILLDDGAIVQCNDDTGVQQANHVSVSQLGVQGLPYTQNKNQDQMIMFDHLHTYTYLFLDMKRCVQHRNENTLYRVLWLWRLAS